MYSELAAVERTMRILELLSAEPAGISVTELAERLPLHKASVSRILSTLEAAGYVAQDPRTDLFTLTWRLVALAYRFADAQPLEEAALPVLRDLAQQTGDLVQLAVAQRDDLFYVAKVEGAKPLRVASMLGRVAPLHASAVGKVWLAGLPETQAMELLGRRGMRPVTEATITDPVAYLQELRQVRAQGYALAREELIRGAVGLAVPVPPDALAEGRPVSTVLVVSAAAFEATPAHLKELRSACQKAAAALAGRLPPSHR